MLIKMLIKIGITKNNIFTNITNRHYIYYYSFKNILNINI